jgi:hypothetical protein
MDKKERIKIISKIGMLEDKHCQGCKLVVRDGRGNSVQFCVSKCVVGKQLRELGVRLAGKKSNKEVAIVKVDKVELTSAVPSDLTVEIYRDLKAQFKSDKQIMLMYGLDHNALYRFKKANGLINQRISPSSKGEKLKKTQKVKEVEIIQKPHILEETPKKEDVINQPTHYHQGGIDVIKFGELQFTSEENKGFFRINAIKYLTRYDRKNGIEDLEKAKFYIDKLIEMENGKCN